MSDEMKQRGPVCECSGEGCFLPLPMNWDQYETHSFALVLISDACPTDSSALSLVEQRVGYKIYSVSPLGTGYKENECDTK